MTFITPYWSLDSIIILTIVLLTSVTIAYYYMTRKFKYWRERGVSEISPIPFLGNFAECVLMKKSLGLVLKEFYDQAEGEPCVGFFVLDKPFLLLRDHEVTKNVLVKDFDHFSDRYFTLDETDRLGYVNLFFIKNPVWKMLRMKMTPFLYARQTEEDGELNGTGSDSARTR